MIIPDANLLLDAYDSRSPHHDAARQWWEDCLTGSETVGLTHPVIFAYLRLATNARIYENPLTIDIAIGHVKSWTERGVTRTLLPTIDHTDRVAHLLRAAGTGGNLVTDAQIAAFALTYQGVIHTADQDFRRFPDVTTSFPLQNQREPRR